MQANADKIIIELIKNESMYKILFSDNGSGIPENQKDRIFDDNFTTKKQGMGLGLSLAKRFMTSINGEIKLQKSSANGSTFEITFPIKQNAVS